MKIIVFTSKNCHSCHPHLLNVKRIAEKFPGVQVEEHPVERYPEEAARFRVRSTPTTIALEGSKPLNTMLGAYPLKEIEQWIKESISLKNKG